MLLADVKVPPLLVFFTNNLAHGVIMQEMSIPSSQEPRFNVRHGSTTLHQPFIYSLSVCGGSLFRRQQQRGVKGPAAIAFPKLRFRTNSLLPIE